MKCNGSDIPETGLSMRARSSFIFEKRHTVCIHFFRRRGLAIIV